MASSMKKQRLTFMIVASIIATTIVICSALTAVGFLNFSRSHTEMVISSMKRSGASAGKLVDKEIATYIVPAEKVSFLQALSKIHNHGN